MRRTRTVRAFVLAAASAVLLAACGGNGTTDEDVEEDAADVSEDVADEEEDGEGEAAAGDDDRTLVIAATGTPGSLDGDIFTSNMQNTVVNVYDPLLAYAPKDSEFEEANGAREVDADALEGRLADSWEVSDDGLTTTIQLKEGVLSFAGNELTAEDVVWSWEKSFDQGRTGNFIANVSNVTGVEAVDEYTVEFTTSDPSPILLRALTLYVPSIYDSTEAQQHATDDDPFATEWLAQNTASFGPWHLESIEPDAQVVFVRNPNYHGDAPYFERIIYQAVPDASNRVSLIEAGQVNLIENPSFRAIVQMRESDNVKVQSVVGNQQARVLMNPNFEPFDSREVRQAINYAIDGEAILDIVFEGIATQAFSPVPPEFDAHISEFWTYDRDLDRSRELLAEAGFEDGLEIELFWSTVWWWEEPMAVQVQSQLAEAGIDVQLTQLPEDEMTSRASISERDMPFFTFYEQSIVLDPGYALFLNSHPEGASDRNDYGRTNPEFVALVEEANTTLDPDVRAELIREAQRIHVEDSPWVYGAMMGTHNVVSPDIEGWIWWPDNQPRWKDFFRS